MKKRLWNYAKTKVHDTSGIEDPHMWTWRQCNGGIYFPDYHIHIAKSEDLWNMEVPVLPEKLDLFLAQHGVYSTVGGTFEIAAGAWKVDIDADGFDVVIDSLYDM